MSKLPQRLIESFEFRGEKYHVIEMDNVYDFQKMMKEPESKSRDAKIAAQVLCDESGTTTYRASELEKTPASFLLAVIRKLLDVSGLSEKAAEEIEKK